MTTELIPVVLAGGSGTRLWPLSREHYPKQFLALCGNQTLLQNTVGRLDGLELPAGIGIGAPFLVCNEEQRFLVAEQLRVLNKQASSIVLEPEGRGTAPALTLAALALTARDEDPLLLMMPADHVITDVKAFQQSVKTGVTHALRGHIVTFGVPPTRAETGYGYIETSASANADALSIVSFKEKPDAQAAAMYFATGRYLWNSGIFLMKASVWLEALERFRPEIVVACRSADEGGSQDGDFARIGRAEFLACANDSIDYAVMEKLTGTGEAKAPLVVKLRSDWSDVGAWSSLWDISARDGNGNVIKGDVYAVQSNGNMLIAEHRFLAVLGCQDMVVVETADAVMVAPKSHSQLVKKVVGWLQKKGRPERLFHRRVYRPWGSYESTDLGDRFQVKRITVKAGGKLSLQMHHHRAEHWVVVNGTARVTRGDEVFLLSENESTYIPLGVKHRLENPGTISLEIIEVQSGPYLGEDDIVRFDDAYNRN